jgi:hypothetical protein
LNGAIWIYGCLINILIIINRLIYKNYYVILIRLN